MTEEQERQIKLATSVPWDTAKDLALAMRHVRKAGTDHPVTAELELYLFDKLCALLAKHPNEN